MRCPIHHPQQQRPRDRPTTTQSSGRPISITRGSKGLGLSVALSLAKVGASNIVLGAYPDLSQLAEQIDNAAISANQSRPNFLYVKLNASKARSVTIAAVEIEREYDRFDISDEKPWHPQDFGLIADSCYLK